MEHSARSGVSCPIMKNTAAIPHRGVPTSGGGAHMQSSGGVAVCRGGLATGSSNDDKGKEECGDDKDEEGSGAGLLDSR